MKTYFFSILVRGLVAVSGFLVFLVSAKLFGADGRGIISYGTSIFASFGLFLSLNLGRTFVGKTTQNESLKKDLIFTFMALNLLAIFASALFGFLFWQFSSSAKHHLELQILLPLITTSFFYVWNVNGSAFFASFQKTHEQEVVILVTRFALVAFLIIFTVLEVRSLFYFICFYSLILSLGVIGEFLLLLKIVGLKRHLPSFEKIKTTLKDSIWPHLDFLAFNIYPLLLVLIAGKYLKTAEIGRVNFAIQIINLVFLLSTTAHIRVSAYVSNFGFRTKMPQVKKLFWATLALSVFASTTIIIILTQMTNASYLGSFEGTGSLFIIATLAIPGYMAYQFFNPILLELKKIKESAIFNLVNCGISLILSPILISLYQEAGCLILFAIFHLGLLIGQITIYQRHQKGMTSSIAH